MMSYDGHLPRGSASAGPLGCPALWHLSSHSQHPRPKLAISEARQLWTGVRPPHRHSQMTPTSSPLSRVSISCTQQLCKCDNQKKPISDMQNSQKSAKCVRLQLRCTIHLEVCLTSLSVLYLALNPPATVGVDSKQFL